MPASANSAVVLIMCLRRFIQSQIQRHGSLRLAGVMKTLSGSILILAGAVVFAGGKIAKSIVEASGRREVPALMLVIGCIFSLIGYGVLIWGLRNDRDHPDAMKTVAGSIIILASGLMFGSAWVAHAILVAAGWNDTPESMLVIGTFFSLTGLGVLLWGLRGSLRSTGAAKEGAAPARGGT